MNPQIVIGTAGVPYEWLVVDTVGKWIVCNCGAGNSATSNWEGRQKADAIAALLNANPIT
jgi:hypothetical protein